QMIRVAAGEELAFGQDDVRLDGWAIETRVYAEDPYRGFLPSTGRLVRYRTPEDVLRQARHERNWDKSSSTAVRPEPVEGRDPYIRIDDGVAEGGEVSMFYDPMIAKLITWAPTREGAADLQVEALDRFEIEGPGHNVDFLSALMQQPRYRRGAVTRGLIAEEEADLQVEAVGRFEIEGPGHNVDFLSARMQHPRYRRGELTTGFIAEEYPEGFDGAPADEARLRLIAAVAAGNAFTRMGQARR